MKLIDKLRLKYTMLTKGMKYPNLINQRLYEKYLGHSKIIGWYGGYPMYSTASPMSLSPIFANKFVTFIMGVLQNRTLPHILDIALTDKCNCNCEHCSFSNKRKNNKELSTEEMKKVLKDSLDLGVTSINFVGGEPLLREDITEIIKSVDKDLAITSVVTNGWYLKEKINELKEASVTTIKVSIDSPYPEIHDKLRNKQGLFNRAVEGLIEAKKNGFITAISCCITKKDIQDGSFEKIIQLGKKLKVNEIIVFDALPVGNYAHRSDLLNDKPILESITKITDKYNKRNGWNN